MKIKSPNPILTTQRLYIREFHPGDAPFMLELVNTPGWLKYVGDKNIHTEEAASRFIEDVLMESYRKNGFGLWMTELLLSHVPIGMCGLVNRDSLDDIDIGFGFLPEYCNKGYAYESAQALFNYAKFELGIHKIVAITQSNNLPSIRLLNRLGLQFEKTVILPGKDEVLLFSPPINPSAQKEIDELTRHFYDLFTNTNGSVPGLDKIYGICIPETIIIKNSGTETEVYDLNSFIKPRQKLLTDGSLTGFNEYEISNTTHIYGHTAQRFSLYEKSGMLNGLSFKSRGMKNIQFVRKEGEWKISSVSWMDEQE